MKFFDTLFINKRKYYEIGAPLYIQEVAIIKDTVDDSVLLRNTFLNIGSKPISAIEIKIALKDYWGDPVLVDEKPEYFYLYEDSTCEPFDTYGNTIAIELPSEARKAAVLLSKVIFLDGEIWESNPEEVIEIQDQEEIDCPGIDLASLDDNDTLPVFYFVENESSWQCTCGQPNKASDESCYNCGRPKGHVKDIFSKKSFQKQSNTEGTHLITSFSPALNRSISQESDENESLSNSKGKYRTAFIIAAVGVFLFLLLGLAFKGLSHDKLIKKTEASLSTYLDYLGERLDTSGTNPVLSFDNEDIYNGMDNVFVMGWTGEVEYSTSSSDSTRTTIMEWQSNETANEADSRKFFDLLEDYFGEKGLKSHIDDITNEDVLLWEDPHTDNYVAVWYEDDQLKMHWEMPNSSLGDEFDSSSESSGSKGYSSSYSQSSTSNSYSSPHTCEVCGKPAAHSITGIWGGAEYYCSTHYNELKDMQDYIYGDN